MKKAVIIGHFGFGYNYSDGQTIKTQNIYNALTKIYGEEQIRPIDTHGSITTFIKAPFMLLKTFFQFKNIIILPAHRGLRVYAPIIWIYKKFFHNVRVHYAVIGGWLPSLLEKNNSLRRTVKSIDYIYVETNTMKASLESLGVKSVVMPNLKMIKLNPTPNDIFTQDEPLPLCTFSRVMKQKGIEDAINAVVAINEKENKICYSLDIYGSIDSAETEWFEELMAKQPEYIKYMGVVSQDKIVDTLSRYFSLLFPTRFYTEGVPGTIIDAYASGLPVIVSKWQSYKDIVEEDVTGFAYEFGNTDEFESILYQILKAPSLVNSLRENCRQYANRYSADEAIRILEERLE